MAKIKRNGPCPCGSGNKAKRCCYGTGEPVHDGMLPREVGVAAVADLKGTDRIELRAYFDQLLDLPELDVSLQVRLPGIITPDMARAINALRDDDGDGFDDAVDKVLNASIRPTTPRSRRGRPQTQGPGSDQPQVRCRGRHGTRSPRIDYLSLLLGGIARRARWRAAHSSRAAPRHGIEPASGI